jgi:hypothetical protein
MLALLACAPALAQEQAEPDAAAEADTEQPAAAPDADEDEGATPEIEDQSYLDIEEDDFRPSEEIPTDQSITFPTDI